VASSPTSLSSSAPIPFRDGPAPPPSLPALYEAAKRALAECRNVDDAKLLRDKALALVVFAAQARDKTLIQDATEIRLRAERRAGELLAEMKERGEREDRGGDRKSKSSGATLILPKLTDLGVTKSQSSNWQRMAGLEAEAFEARVDRAKRKAINVLDGTSRRTRQELHAEDEARVARLRPLLGSTFLTLVIDFPWKSDWLSESAQATPGYATMARAGLFALPVGQWAAENCHLYFLSPNNFLPLAFEAVAHYGSRHGFAYKTLITWEKPEPFGQGHYFRNQTEHCLFAVRGELRTRVDNIPTILRAPRGAEHSEKPEALYDLVRAASYLPAGEAFQRQLREGFVNLYYAAREAAE
jgi:N6-adenosine-specific RNA methylase IME4